jgi:hypothetical protein
MDMDWGALFGGESGPSMGSVAEVAAVPHAVGGGGFNFGDVASRFGDFASNVGSGLRNAIGTFGDIAKVALPIANIGTGIMGGIASSRAASAAADNAKTARRAADIQASSAERAAAAAAPLTNFGEAQLKAATAGQIPEAEQAMIDEWVRGAKQQAMDYLARSGQGDSSTMQDWAAWIDKQAVAMKGSALGNAKASGVGALTAGAGALTGAAGAAGGAASSAGAQGGQLEQLIAAANQQLARLSASAS